MLADYSRTLPKYSKIDISQERRLIAKAKKGCPQATEEVVLRHVGFIIFRIYKKTFPTYIDRFGEDILSQAVFILYDKINTYNLRYKNKEGQHSPVRFASYVWKRIDGFILDSLKKEITREKRQTSLNWERFERVESHFELCPGQEEGQD